MPKNRSLKRRISSMNCSMSALVDSRVNQPELCKRGRTLQSLSNSQPLRMDSLPPESFNSDNPFGMGQRYLLWVQGEE